MDSNGSSMAGSSSMASSPSRQANRPIVRQIVKIITSDFPQYFAVISRVRQETQIVGPESSIVQSSILPRARIHVPPK